MLEELNGAAVESSMKVGGDVVCERPGLSSLGHEEGWSISRLVNMDTKECSVDKTDQEHQKQPTL